MTHSTTAWHFPPEELTLADDEVHVWRVWLNPATGEVEALHRTLSAGERERAGRFYFAKDRRRFIVARGSLRAILGDYLHLAPERVRFAYGTRGKPALAGDLEAGALRFNVAHSHELALIAATRGREIGVDVERLRSIADWSPITRRFFSPLEVATLSGLPTGLQPEAFFAVWTRKEAYIKARGDGLSLPLDEFDVSVAPDEPAALLSTPGNEDGARRWSLRALTPAPGYAAAIAVEWNAWRLRCWQWPRRQNRLAAADSSLLDARQPFRG